ncbi:Tubulin-specific chaperone E [Lachnellula willkommii]|uniref:Tubulin-specific chaperone E n=1 Tax=Lachnellula willkommii TaxID=215461 RepID=A0A559MLQ5_9HELO|nr:Tubulin-specific chaperone E [Lachnellula willkommii]
MPSNYHVGQRISFESALCTVRYIGPVEGTEKEWLGVEWDDPTRGKHDGEHKGKRYFTCSSKARTAGSFVRPTRQADPEQSFVEAVHQKYAAEITNQQAPEALDKQIVISGKVAEEVGFDKIRLQLSQLHELKIIIVDGLRINCAEKDGRAIREVCPKIVELDLSRNLFEIWEEVVHICRELDDLRSLRLKHSGNRFESGLKSSDSNHKTFRGITELEMDDMLLPWRDLAETTEQFLTLTALAASSNHLIELDYPLKASNLKSLTLEYNDFTSLSDVSILSDLASLETLRLKGNNISIIAPNGPAGSPIFGSKLQYVDLSYNSISSWDFVDDLPAVFPGLTALRLSHNPIYESRVKDTGSSSIAEEGYMLTLARLGNLKTLNFSNITTADRTNAEMYYLSQIGKEMAEVPESDEHTIVAKHKRYHELCKKYDAPIIVRKDTKEINPNFLEARLITFTFYMPPNTKVDQEEAITIKRQIPKSFDVYRVKGLVGRMFDIPPLDSRLTWETGEWDPIAGYEEWEDDSSDDEDEEDDQTRAAKASVSLEDKGKWMKREVEIEESARKIGFCVDGMEANIRVELSKR